MDSAFWTVDPMTDKRTQTGTGIRVRRILVALTMMALAVAVSSTPALAGRKWCAKDPIVSLNGVPVQIWIAVPEQYVPAINGPVTIVVKTPAEVDRDVVFTDAGFNGHGELVEFGRLPGAQVAKDGSFMARISATVPVDTTMLSALGSRHTHIPYQITVVANGVLQFLDGGTPQITDGETWVKQGTTRGTTVTVTVRPTPTERARYGS